MKISPVAAGGAANINPNEGMSAGMARLAKAKAVAAGQDPATVQTSGDSQVDRVQNTIKRLKMRTQVSPDRHNRIEEVATVDADAANPPETKEGSTQVTDTLAPTEQAVAASEETKPLSPQFAALARQRREVQIAQKQLADQKAAFEAEKQGLLAGYISKEALKSSPLKTLTGEGVTYDQLTEEILASSNGNADLSEIRAEIKSLKEGLDKNLSERDATAEKQALAQIRREADQLIAQGEDFEMVREAGYAPKVVELIHRIYKKTGEVLDTSEAAALIEKELLEESLKFAKIKKVQSRLNPTQPQQTQPLQQERPGTKIMRTLTNRDGASSTSMNKRERAIAAMEGRLK